MARSKPNEEAQEYDVMDIVRKAADHLEGIVPYDPQYLPAKTMLSANENTVPVPDALRYVIDARINALGLNRYPDPLANRLRGLIADKYGLERCNVLVGNGGDELLFALALAWGGPGRAFLNMPPTFSVYEHNAKLTYTETVKVPRTPDFSIDADAVLERVGAGDIDYIVVTSPNNPTGNVADPGFVRELLAATDALVLLDEAYAEFSDTTMTREVADNKNLVVLRTFSKAYSLAGVRLGYVLGDPYVINELTKVRQPYSVSGISQVVGESVFENRKQFEPRIREIIAERELLFERLGQIRGVKPYPSQANYILFEVAHAAEIWQNLYDRSILIRDLSRAPYLRDCLRVSIGTTEENEAFIAALECAIQETDMT